MGKAKGYVKQIAQLFNHAGYDVQLFLLNAAFMGVPQRRERTFFIAKRKNLNFGKLDLKFDEKPIKIKDAWLGLTEKGRDVSSSKNFKYWEKTKPGKSFSSVHEVGSLFNSIKVNPDTPMHTLTGNGQTTYHWETMRNLSSKECYRAQSFPDDYQYKSNTPWYITGMSVPPYMMNRISKQIELQWLKEQ